MRSSRLFIAAAAALVLGIAAVAVRSEHRSVVAGEEKSADQPLQAAMNLPATPSPSEHIIANAYPEISSEPVAPGSSSAGAEFVSTEAASPPDETSSAVETAHEQQPEDIHYYNGRDPNAQPREIYHLSLAGKGNLPSGYEATGDFQLTEEGWTLTPPEAGEEENPRIAMFESPAIQLNFESNAVNPLWKERSPDGTEVLVEVSLSQDGHTWTDWMPTTSGHYEGDMSPTYPDGRPNPNYGYTLGDMTFYGLKRFQFFRFAMTLYSETADAPVVSDFRLFYQDSTMGDTSMAQEEQTEPTGATP